MLYSKGLIDLHRYIGLDAITIHMKMFCGGNARVRKDMEMAADRQASITFLSMTRCEQKREFPTHSWYYIN